MKKSDLQIKVESVKLRGNLRLHAEPGKKPFVFIAFADFDLVIPTFVPSEDGKRLQLGNELRISINSAQLKQWEDGFSVQMPSHEYTGRDGERQHGRRVRLRDEATRTAITNAMLSNGHVAALATAAQDLLRTAKAA